VSAAQIPNLFDALDATTEAALRASIERFGVLVPVVRDQHGRTLDGHHRSRLADELGIKYRVDVVRVEDDDHAREIAATLNTDRRQLTPEQRRKIAAVYLNAKRADGVGLHSVNDVADRLGISQPAARKIEAELRTSSKLDDEITHRVGQDNKVRPARRPTVVAAKDDRQAAKAQQALASPSFAPTDEHTVAAGDLIREVRTAERRERTAELAATSPPQATGIFSVLCADPPWRYDANPTPDSRAIENHYPTMTADELAALPLPAADDAVLFLWVTSPKLVEGVELMQAWGFDYRTCMVWVKDKIGMGYYARQQHELLLIGRRGDLPVPEPSDRPSSVISAPRERHSAKPAEAYELIERMYPRLPRVEIFARGPRPGWAVWGNEADGQEQAA
jgi:N6-adenosine-specific RNA methylase IME4/ParB-like chromosome segregation protein Spo0J